ncbi:MULTISPECIES: hypothetical protein [unclassified Lactococcus]|uniref:hypothetical protein n=1 Tax=unclassified Lactococcus TaxID=2643510 RepID=UPI0011CAAA54|nr:MULTISPECIES: hypothetical protein [unclassified Lactococcus]MQW24023.1 hypothetical protein [Lactococcus sp. dk101]TXK36608.1 hypothetical protein FVP42_11050 [Lactococcus sp. dk310]TXK46920.1 hypothetical protein FVP43_10655 [Lactococcus sp. dk322]
MLSYLTPDSLEKYGVANFDSWVSAFEVIEDNFELTVSGTFKVNRRFTKFGNLQELMNMFGEVWDIQTQEMLNLPVPEHEVKIIKSHVTPTQAKYINDLVERATQIEHGAIKPWEDNMLKIVSEN